MSLAVKEIRKLLKIPDYTIRLSKSYNDMTVMNDFKLEALVATIYTVSGISFSKEMKTEGGAVFHFMGNYKDCLHALQKQITGLKLRGFQIDDARGDILKELESLL